MILEKETFAKYNYYSDTCSRKSDKLIIFKCDYCGNVFEREKWILSLEGVNITHKHNCNNPECKSSKKLEINNYKIIEKSPKKGQKIGKWTILDDYIRCIKHTYNKINKWNRFIECRCDCGTIRWVDITSLKLGLSKSCAGGSCLKLNGESHTPFYRLWRGIKDRCYNPKVEAFKYYGAKGITICDEWLDFLKFKEWSFLNGFKRGLTLHRINSSKGYSPNNCIWIPRSEHSVETQKDVKQKREKQSLEIQSLKNKVLELEREILNLKNNMSENCNSS